MICDGIEIFTSHKRSFRQGNVFTHVCYSVYRGGGCYSVYRGGGLPQDRDPLDRDFPLTETTPRQRPPEQTSSTDM